MANPRDKTLRKQLEEENRFIRDQRGKQIDRYFGNMPPEERLREASFAISKSEKMARAAVSPEQLRLLKQLESKRKQLAKRKKATHKPRRTR